jgi:hypothetical protein
VVLRHEGVDEPHFDVLFDVGAELPLATWRVGRWPIEPGDPAIRAADHRRVYLAYEGPIAGGRGSVRRVADIPCSVVLQDDRLEAVFADGTLVLVAEGGPTWRRSAS